VRELGWRTWVYMAVTVLAAGVAGARWIHWGLLEPRLGGLALLAGMWAVFDACSVRLPGRGTVSVTSLITFLSVTAYGPDAGIVVVLLGSAAAAAFSRRPWYKSVFNAAQFALAAALAGLAYQAAGGTAGQKVDAAFLAPYYALVATHLLVNSMLLSLLFFTLDGQAPWRNWWSIISTSWPNVIASLFSGIFLQAAYTSLSLLGVLFVFVLLLGVRFTFKLFVDAQNFYLEIVHVLTRVLEVKDPFTSGHSERVARLAEEIGREMGFFDRSLELLKNSALMHDVGKVAIPDSILVKPGPLTAAERVQMDLHVDAGNRILREAAHLQQVSDFVGGHHEHFDGSGYPRRLAGREIPLASRIIAAADAFDAMATDRPYRSALPLTEVMVRLQEGASQQFDPEVLRVLFRLKGYDPETGILAGDAEGHAASALRPAIRFTARSARGPVAAGGPAAGPKPVAPAAAPSAADVLSSADRVGSGLPRKRRRKAS
jgi:putative nucleotidyltransferase with HDIG domain